MTNKSKQPTAEMKPSIVVGDMKIYSVEDVSKLLNLHIMTVRRYLKTGKIKAQKLGKRWYVTEEAIQDYFTGGRHE